ncbi:signal peptidase I [uncultured Microbacterium sp.]|uniref:signal peptidase I n=1 Tax=uncultured Microbacterium sp. TaxID=191216 RepID=UPI0025E71E59|nr:signal peptidase I [uncultured Microbacterium sp.]
MSEVIPRYRPRDRSAARTARPAWRRARTILSTVLLAVVSLFALITVVIPLLLGAQTYTVLTGSMQPGMPPGTLIAVRPTSIDDVRVGEVVTYQIRSGDPAVVTHRVVGTTSSTGGDRLLITRGDANNTDDPPVQAEQLRGTVVLAVPYLGYPGVVFGGQERGAVIAVIGVAVVGYGIVLLVTDFLRSRRRRAAPTAVVALVVVLSSAPLLSPPPAAASDGPSRLLVSEDGVRFVADGSVRVFDASDRIVPGDTRRTTLWIRNSSTDPARAGLRLDAAPASSDEADRALADAMRLVVAAASVPAGTAWVSEVIPAGDTLRVEVGLRMDAAADNTSREGFAHVTPVVLLTDATADGTSGAAGPSGVLPWTGIRDTPFGLLVAVAGAIVATGVLVRIRRVRDR